MFCGNLFCLNTMHHLPIQTDTYFNTYARIPDKFRKFLIPAARYHFKTDGVNSTLDMNIALEGFSIWVHYFWLKTLVNLKPFNTKDVYVLHFWLSRHPESTLIFLKAEEHEPWPARGHSLSMHINVDPVKLSRLTKEYPALEQLNQSPQISNRISAVNVRILKKILRCRYIGAAAECYLRKYCAILYSNYLTQPPKTSITPETRWKLYRIMQYAGSHPQKIQSYEALADQFDIDFETMKIGFEQEFHIPLYDFVFQERMDLAFKLLMHHNLDTVARKLGYRTSFLCSADFELFFGCTPLQLQMAQ
jgi:AraC-like DNA-binding protein